MTKSKRQKTKKQKSKNRKQQLNLGKDVEGEIIFLFFQSLVMKLC